MKTFMGKCSPMYTDSNLGYWSEQGLRFLPVNAVIKG